MGKWTSRDSTSVRKRICLTSSLALPTIPSTESQCDSYRFISVALQTCDVTFEWNAENRLTAVNNGTHCSEIHIRRPQPKSPHGDDGRYQEVVRPVAAKRASIATSIDR